MNSGVRASISRDFTTMKNILRGSIAALSLLAFTGGAQAADLADVPSYWNGFYIGAQAGYYDTDLYFEGVGGPGDFSFGFKDGATIGGYAGFNWQLDNNFVIGLEGDYNAALGSSVFSGKKAGTADMDSFGSIRARIGYAIDSTLIYATGGLALAHIDFGPGDGLDDLSAGYVVGGGVEHFVTNNVSLKGEFLYMDYPDLFTGGGTSVGIDGYTVRVGAAWHFN